MKTNFLSTLIFGCLLLLSACANDDIATGKQGQKESDTAGMTSFSIDNDSSILPLTRTGGEYTGSGIKFYWIEGDYIWVNNTALSPAWQKDKKNNISELLTASNTGRTSKAKFWFEGSFTASQHPVRYTGREFNPQVNEITIHNEQSADTPNNSFNLGHFGDCGIGTAYRQSNGKYSFILDHKASYITFLPYHSQDVLKGVRIKEIKIWSPDQAICGSFKFNENGIDLSSRPSPEEANRYIKFNCVGKDFKGFDLPTSPKKEANAAIMVIAPGTYNKLYTQYTLYDPVDGVSATITKSYDNVTFLAGKNKEISTDLHVLPVDDKWYMWDAQDEYWAGHKDAQPKHSLESSSENPKSKEADPTRWYSEVNIPTPASQSARNCPNANEVAWYLMLGHTGYVYWDNTVVWSVMGHLYTGGIWLRKQSAITAATGKSVAELKRASPDGTDITQTPIMGPSAAKVQTTVGKPANLGDYFFLPALGAYYHSGFNPNGPGQSGYYWLSSSSTYDAVSHSGTAFCLVFDDSHARIENEIRMLGFRVWNAQ